MVVGWKAVRQLLSRAGPVRSGTSPIGYRLLCGGPPGRALAGQPGRMPLSGPWGDGYEALIWLVLIALLGLYGWYAASVQPLVEKPAVVAFRALDSAIQGMGAEQADLERQLAEAKGRIAALEEAVSRQRQPTAAPQPSVALSVEPLPSAPSLASQVAELWGRRTGQAPAPAPDGGRPGRGPHGFRRAV